jgi:hypothetical protein
MERHGVLTAFKKMKPEVEVQHTDLTNGTTDVSEFYGIRAIPAFVVIGDDGHVIRKLTGPRTAEQLARQFAA